MTAALPPSGPIRTNSHLATTTLALLATAATATAQVDYVFDGGVLEQVVVNGQTIPQTQLVTGVSSGAVSSFSEAPITAADDLSLSTYFARGDVSPSLWTIDFPEPWNDTSGAVEDFFLVEAGGNDTVRVSAVFVDGTVGASIQLNAWSAIGLQVQSGPNASQPWRALAFSGTDLLDTSGQSLGTGDLIAGLQIDSSTIDGAILTWRGEPEVGPPAQLRPTIAADVPVLTPGDAFQTPVTLTTSFPASAGDFSYVWVVPGATFVNGTDALSPSPTVTFAGDAPTHAEVVVVPTGAPELLGKGRLELGLDIPGPAVLYGSTVAAQKVELRFNGPVLDSFSDTPNPFLDRRLDVTFTKPDGSEQVVPGFFDGNGEGGPIGTVWKARLTPDQAGTWTYRASFRAGVDVAVDDDPLAGSPAWFDGGSGSFEVAPRDESARGFLARGHLRHVGAHYRRFDDGSYFVKAGTNSPENLFAFRGFEGTEDQNTLDGIHEYAPHRTAWTVFDPELPNGTWDGDRALIGALNYLESEGVNSIYFLPMNLGGDGRDTAPFVGFSPTPYDVTHYAVGRLLQWETVLWEATRRGIHIHFVLAETESANEQWFDDGGFGLERRLYFRELMSRFGHHLAMTWNLSEENDFGNAQLAAMAQHLNALDSYGHTVTFHTRPDDIDDFDPFYDNDDFVAGSIQYTPDLAGQHVEDVRQRSAAAGKPWAVGMDENTPWQSGLTDQNAPDLRKRVLYDVLFSGGHVEWYAGYHPLPLGGDLKLEDFSTREEMWRYMRYARELLEDLPIWLMEPRDDLVTGEALGEFGEAEVFALPGEAYAVYLPDATSAATLDLSLFSGAFRQRWFDPRTGEFAGPQTTLQAGAPRSLGLPPYAANEDWVAIVRRPPLWANLSQISVSSNVVLELELDGGPSMAGVPYLVLGSAAGTTPGIPLVTGGVLPLNADPYFTLTLAGPSPIANSLGVLDDAGRATATLNGLGSNPPVGISISHAWVADPFGIPLPSNPVTVPIVP